MKTILKRNQIIIIVIALMLVSAGYLNYNTMQKKTEETTAELLNEQNIDYASIGDAKLVSSALVENINEGINEINETAIVENIFDGESNSNDIITTTTNNVDKKDIQEYFSSSRLSREKMYSQMLETYEDILESTSVSETQKAIAQTEIKNINDIKNKIMICENLIKNKDIEDVVIFVNDNSVSTVVRCDELKQEQIAQIQNIIAREMNIEITNIHISNK